MHPLQIRILERGLAALDQRFSPKELAVDLAAPIGNVSDHVRALLKLGLLTKAGSAQRRGAVEHYYRIAKSALG